MNLEEKIENQKGFMDEFLGDLEYSLWDQWYGCDFGTFRFQLGNVISNGQIVDGFYKIDIGLRTCRLNLLEEKGNGDYIWWGTFKDRRSAIDALSSLLEFQEFCGESGKTFKEILMGKQNLLEIVNYPF